MLGLDIAGIYGQAALHKVVKKGHKEWLEAIYKTPGVTSRKGTESDIANERTAYLLPSTNMEKTCNHEDRGCGGTTIYLAIQYHSDERGTVEVIRYRTKTQREALLR